MADAIGDGSRTLRPSTLQRLLETVRSVKLRRLTPWFADRHAQPWRERLEPDRIGLDTGNSTLAPKGRLDSTDRITYRSAALDQPPRHVLVQDARDERLVRDPLA